MNILTDAPPSPPETEQTALGLPIDRDTIFSNHKNVYKRRLEKRQTRLLRRVEFLAPFLEPGEKILLVTTGCSPMPLWEQFTLGWVIVYLKRSLFVFTDRRIFHIPTTTTSFRYRHSLAHIRYEDCAQLRRNGNKLIVKYHTGASDKFLHLARGERKKIKALLAALPSASVPQHLAERTHLCPRCTGELVRDQFVCPHCQLEFKSKARARQLSITLPGGGYFYTGHPFLGLSDAAGELMLIFYTAVSLVDVFRGDPQARFPLIFFAVLLILEKLFTIQHASAFVAEFIPTERHIHTDPDFAVPANLSLELEDAR